MFLFVLLSLFFLFLDDSFLSFYFFFFLYLILFLFLSFYHKTHPHGRESQRKEREAYHGVKGKLACCWTKWKQRRAGFKTEREFAALLDVK